MAKLFKCINNFEYVIVNSNTSIVDGKEVITYIQVNELHSYYTYIENIFGKEIEQSINSILDKSFFDIENLFPKYCQLFKKLYKGSNEIDFTKARRVLYQNEKQSLTGERILVFIDEKTFIIDITIIDEFGVVGLNPLLSESDLLFIRSIDGSIKNAILKLLNN